MQLVNQLCSACSRGAKSLVLDVQPTDSAHSGYVFCGSSVCFVFINFHLSDVFAVYMCIFFRIAFKVSTYNRFSDSKVAVLCIYSLFWYKQDAKMERKVFVFALKCCRVSLPINSEFSIGICMNDFKPHMRIFKLLVQQLQITSL